ncbi:MAG: cephalosporin hydroxylase family protein [Alphaproteobacteria bacterium]
MSRPIDSERPGLLRALREDAGTQRLANALTAELTRHKYPYHFDWLGIPIIQCPQDMVALQEIIWRTKPDVVVETGVAYGGSLVLSASVLKLLGKGKVIGVDILIKPKNRAAIEAHPLAPLITLIEGSSVEDTVVAKVKSLIPDGARVMVVLDSDHTHAHVLAELERYAPLVTKGCYLVVMDSVIEDLPPELFEGKRWGKGNNPKTALHAFLKTTDRFAIDSDIDGKLLITATPDGFLRCVK